MKWVWKCTLLILSSYLNNHKQRTKINNKLRSWKDLINGVLQGSLLGPLLFNMYLNDLFFFLQDVNACNLADDTTTFPCGRKLENALKTLEEHSEIAIRCLENSCMKLNDKPCLPCLPSRWVYSLCSMAPYDWANGGSVDVFLDVEYGFTSMGSFDTIPGNVYGI